MGVQRAMPTDRPGSLRFEPSKLTMRATAAPAMPCAISPLVASVSNCMKREPRVQSESAHSMRQNRSNSSLQTGRAHGSFSEVCTHTRGFPSPRIAIAPDLQQRPVHRAVRACKPRVQIQTSLPRTGQAARR